MAISDDIKYSLTGAEIKTLINKVNEKAPASNVYTKTEIDSKLTSAMTYKGTVATVTDLHSTGNKVGDVYNVTETGDNYAWDGSNWDQLSGVVDLSNYYTKTETDAELDTKVDKVSGKGLSEEDFTTAEKTKLSGIESGAEANTIESISVNGTQQTITNKNVDLTIRDGIKTLTTDDYNWPTADPDGVAAWKLASGLYRGDGNTRIYIADNQPYYNVSLLSVPDMTDNQQKTGIIVGRYTSTGSNGQAYLLSFDTSGASVLGSMRPQDTLSSTLTSIPLSANQGKVLNEKIGDLSTLTTTNKTSAVNAINEVNSAVSNLPINGGTIPPSPTTQGQVGQLYSFVTLSGEPEICMCTAVNDSTTPTTYTWKKVGVTLQLSTTDPGEDSPLADNTILGIYQ